MMMIMVMGLFIFKRMMMMNDTRGSAFKDYKHCDYRLDKGLSIVIRDYLITCQSST